MEVRQRKKSTPQKRSGGDDRLAAGATTATPASVRWIPLVLGALAVLVVGLACMWFVVADTHLERLATEGPRTIYFAIRRAFHHLPVFRCSFPFPLFSIPRFRSPAKFIPHFVPCAPPPL